MFHWRTSQKLHDIRIKDSSYSNKLFISRIRLINECEIELNYIIIRLSSLIFQAIQTTISSRLTIDNINYEDNHDYNANEWHRFGEFNWFLFGGTKSVRPWLAGTETGEEKRTGSEI